MGLIDKLKNDLLLHVLKATLSRHMANTGNIDENSALMLIEKGLKMTGPIPAVSTTPQTVAPGTILGQFGNVIATVQAWITANLGPDIQLLITELPAILQLISILSAL
jgi:hypothetical protein